MLYVTPCALASCHVLISKQDSTVRAVGYNRCVTGRRPRDENHEVRFGQSAENRSRARDTQPIRSSPGRRYGKKKSSWKKIWEEEVLSLSIRSPPPSLTHHRNINPFENKVWEIYFYKEVCSYVHCGS